MNEIDKDFPGPDVEDLKSALASISQEPWLKPERVYVVGTSTGGTLAAMLTARSQQVAAAALVSPMLDWATQAFASDIGAHVSGHWLPGPPWRHPEQYRSRSPLGVVADVRSPTLLLCGDNDTRAPPEQCDAYFGALKLAGTDAELIRVAGESHGIAGTPRALELQLMSIIGWFDRHSGKPTGARAVE